MKIVTCAAVLLAVSVMPARARADVDPAMTDFSRGAFAEALGGWMSAAAAGDGRAARYVGVLYDTGEGVAQDQATALLWYQRAAALGDVAGMFNAAVCFDAGRGTARDPAAAARWYRRAAAHRFGRAEYNLALMTADGDGVRRDPQAAARLFLAASQDGIDAARTHLAGRIRPALQHAAVDAPDAAFAAAQRALLDRTPQAAAQAAMLFARAATGNGPAAAMARYDLAWCYQNGIGVPADRRQAYRLFVQVAAQTDDPVLGVLARTGAEASGPLHVTVSEASRPEAAETPAVFPGGRSD